MAWLGEELPEKGRTPALAFPGSKPFPAFPALRQCREISSRALI
jgi:hypothetical protein